VEREGGITVLRNLHSSMDVDLAFCDDAAPLERIVTRLRFDPRQQGGEE